MKELDCVKIVKLLQADRSFNGTMDVKRPPQIGEVGAIIYSGDGYYIVENVNSDGYTVWLADFVSEELEIIES